MSQRREGRGDKDQKDDRARARPLNSPVIAGEILQSERDDQTRYKSHTSRNNQRLITSIAVIYAFKADFYPPYLITRLIL